MIYQLTLILFSVTSFLSAILAYNKIEIITPNNDSRMHYAYISNYSKKDLNSLAENTTNKHDYPSNESELGENLEIDLQQPLQDWQRMGLK